VFILTAVRESDEHNDVAIPEAELLIASLRDSLSAAPRCADWPALATLAETHGVLPLVHRALSAAGTEIPDDFQRAVVNSRQSSEMLAAQLEQLLAGFAQHGIDVIPLKGPVLAETLYGDVAMRPCEDLDLLVRVRDFRRAEKVLIDAGWIAPSPADEFERQFLRNGVLVELHFGVASPRSFPFDLDGAWSRAQTASFRGLPMLALSETDRALYLLLHGLKHGFGKLIWILDAAHALNAVKECSPREIVEQARTLGLEQVLYVGCAMILEAFPQQLPEDLLAVLADSPKDMEAAHARVATLLAGEAGTGRSPELSFYLQTETERVRRWQCRLMFFSPTGEDYQWTARHRLPNSFAPLVRPFRLLVKYGFRQAWRTAFPPSA
jgi:hypothetical protein